MKQHQHTTIRPPVKMRLFLPKGSLPGHGQILERCGALMPHCLYRHLCIEEQRLCNLAYRTYSYGPDQARLQLIKPIVRPHIMRPPVAGTLGQLCAHGTPFEAKLDGAADLSRAPILSTQRSEIEQTVRDVA